MAKKKQPARVISSFDELDASGIGAGYTPYAVQEDEQTAPAPESSGLIRRIAGDGILTAVKGFIGVPEAAVGLADMASRGHVGKALENEDGAIGFRPKQAKEYLDQFYSPEQKAAFAAVQNAANKDDPFLTRVGDIAGAAIRNPSTIVHAVGESLPSIGAGGLAARGVLAGATAMSPAIAAARAAPFVASQGARSSLSMAQLAAAGAGEGIVSAGSTAEQIRQGTKDGLMTGEQSLIAAGSGIATMGIGMVAAKAAKSLGVGDIDTLLLGGKHVDPALQKGFVRQLLEGAVTEGVMEELPQSVQEQVAQNYALGKPLDEGVDHAAVMGVLTGGAMGVGAQVMHRTQPVPEVGPLSRGANLAGGAVPPSPVVPPAVPPAGTGAQPVTPEAPATGAEGSVSNGTLPETVPPVEELPPESPGQVATLPPTDPATDAEGAISNSTLPVPEVATLPPESTPEAQPFDTAAAMEQYRAETLAAQQAEADRVAYEQHHAQLDQAIEPPSVDELFPLPSAPEVATLPPSPAAPTEPVAQTPPANDAAPTVASKPVDIKHPTTGKPFTSKPGAMKALKLAGDGHEVVKVDGGFVVRAKDTNGTNVQAPGLDQPAATGSSDKPGGSGVTPVVEPANGRTGELQNSHGPDTSSGQTAPVPPASGSTDAVAPGGNVATAKLPPTDIRIGDTVRKDGKDYTVTQGIDGGVAATRLVSTQNGVTQEKTIFLKGDEAIRAKLEAESGNSSTAADENPEWTRLPHADRLALNTRAGMSKLVADKIARTPWADITPKTREKITAAMAAPVRSSETANAPVTGKPSKPEIVVDKAEMRPYRKPDGSVGYEAVPIVEDKHAAPAIPKKLTVYRAENSGRGIKTDAIQGGTYYFDNKEAADLWAGDAGNVVEREIETSGASIQDVSEGELIHRGEPVLIRRDPEGSGKILEIVVFDKYKQKTTPAPADTAQAATESVAKPDAKAALSEREKAAKAKMFNALGKLATLAGKNTRMNWTQEEEQQLLPIVIELFDGAMELGAVTFQQAVAYVREFISTNLDQETADAIPFDTLQGAYISVAGRHKDKGVTSKKEVVSFESLAELENTAGKADTVTKDQPNEPTTGNQPDTSGTGVQDEQPGELQPDAGTVRRGNAKSNTGNASRGTDKNAPPDFVPAAGGLTREGSWFETAKRNIDLIELAIQIEAEKRPATPAEQARLAKYVGFGASAIRNELFPVPPAWAKAQEPSRLIWPQYVRNDRFKPLAVRIEALPREWQQSILQSSQYAHYTSEGIIRSVWSALQRMGFMGGQVFEPGMGIGSFSMLMPDAIRAESRYTGVEFDAPTALIAKLLSPQQNMLHGDFIKGKYPKNFFDVNVGNPPFAQTKIFGDPEYAKKGFMIHDFFFAKGIDLVRPGGIQVFVTSKGTMDKQTDKARKYLSERADLLGAIRLPSTAFEDNAGTSVVTDVIFLRKRQPGEAPAGESWANTAAVETPDGPVVVNEYFAKHPEMVLGQQRISGNTDDQGRRINSNGMGGEKYTVVSYDTTPAELEAKFAKAIEKLPEGAYAEKQGKTEKAKDARVDFDPSVKREGVVYLAKDGTLMRVAEGVGVPLANTTKLNEKDQAWFKSYVGLRDLVQAARFAQLNEGSWEAALAKLNKAYDKFVKEHGHVLDYRVMTRKSTDEEGNVVETESRIPKNRRLLREDYDQALVTSLESIAEDGSIVKSPFLKGRTIGKPVSREVKSIGDALAVSLDDTGHFDLADVGKRLKLDEEATIEALGNQIYQTPDGQWQLADEYLAGDVVAKLEEAEAAARINPDLKRNVEALKEAQPEKLGPAQISAKLGASWIPEAHVNEFSKEIGAGRVTFDPHTETWQVDGGNKQTGRMAGAEYGTARRSPSELLEAILNSRSIKITQTIDKKTAPDQAATTAANEMAKKIKDKFRGWVWTDTDRATELVESYNKNFNNLAPRKFDGSHLTLPGVSLRYKLHPHQLRAIWRMVQTGNTYLAHAVGAGKTIEMIAGGMEQKRLGLIKKPMYVVPNHMLEQFSNEFMELYPLANIMVADDENFSPERRKAFIASATLNSPDAIVITHDAFQRIGVKEESVAPIRDEILADLEIELSETAKGNDTRVRRGQLEQQIEAVKQRFDRIVGAGAKDSTIKFEDMGVDFVFADEAHVFRKLDFHTAQQIKGIDPNGSKRALDMYVKTRILEQKKPGRSMVFASGTPVTNTMGELYTIMRFFAGAELDKSGISTFDAWARQFGEVAPALEPNAAGKYELIERFAKFDNVPELMSRVRQFMDVLTSDNLGALVKRPDIIGGKPNLNIIPTNSDLTDYMKGELAQRIETSRAWKPSKDQPYNPDPIVAIITDGRFAAIDPRFFGGTLKEGDKSIITEMGDKVVASYHATKNDVYLDKDKNEEKIKGSTQIVFYNLGFGEQSQKSRGFNSRAAFTKRLTDGGIPRAEIAWFDDANSDAKKEAVFKAMRNGTIKVLIGSAKKMGTGVNVQKRLAVLHYQDPPWFPADVEQPHGRILRQGNQNEEIAIEWYTTKGTYQSTMWQMVGRKQRFIDQAFTGDKTLRSMDDLGEASLFEQAAAVASGDPRAIQLAGLKQDVERFTRLQAAHASEQISVRSALNSAIWQIESDQKSIKTLEKAFKAIGEKYFAFTGGSVNGRDYVKPGEFGQAIKDEFNKVAADSVMGEPVQDKQIASIGTAIKVTMDAYIKSDKTPDGTFDIYVEFGGSAYQLGNTAAMGADVDAAGLARRIFNKINEVDRDLQNARRSLAANETDAIKLRKKLGAPFEYQQEMAEKYGELKRLEGELEAEGKATPAPAPTAFVVKADGTANGEAPESSTNLNQTGAPEGNTSDVLFSQNLVAPKSSGPKPTLEQIQGFVEKILQVAKNVIPVSVIASPHEIAGVKVPVGTKPTGAVVDGRIYLFADNISSVGSAYVTLFHEVFHLGLQKVIPAEDYAAMLKQFANSPLVAKYIRLWKASTEGQQMAKSLPSESYEALANEEALAMVSETLAANAGMGTKNLPGLAKLMLNWMAKVADAIGLPPEFSNWVRDLSRTEAERFVTDMTRAVLGGQKNLTKTQAKYKTAVDGLGGVGTRFSTLGGALTAGMNNVREVGLPAGYKVADLFQGEGRLSYWHKSVGTMYNLAQRSPPFKRVFDSVQNFLNDVSFYAAEAADLAPSILPKLDKIGDIFKSPLSAADTKALSRPVFEGTLTWGRDKNGKVKPMEEIESEVATLPLDERAHMLVKERRVSPDVLRMWQGLPQEQYEAIINGKFEREFIKAGVVFTPAELREHFGMTDAQVALYQEFRKATDKSIDNLAISEMLNYAGKDAVAIRDDVLASGSVEEAGQTMRDYLVSLTEIEPERDEALSATAAKMLDIAAHATDMKDRGYAPLSRFGNYTLEATLPTGERYFSLFETDRERNKMARMLTSQGATGVSAGTMSQEAYKLLNGITPETAALFGEMLGLESQGSEAKDLAFQEYIKRGTANRSAMKRLLQRKGIAGFSEDSGRVLAGFIYSNSRRTSSNLHAKETTEAVSAIPKEQGELKDTAVKLHEYVSNPAEEAQAFRGILFAQYLGGSVASAMVNATQPFTVTLPYLTQFGGVKKAAAQMVAALRDATKDTTGNAALDAALKKAEEEGIVSPQEVHSLQAQAMGRAQLQAGDGTTMGNALAMGNNAISKMSLAWGKVFGLAEQFNRRTTFIAAYRTAIEQGIANPAKFAEKAVMETQFVYNKGNKPRWGRGAIGATLFTFKQYSVNYLEMVHRMATAGEPGSPERAAGRKAAVLAIAILFMMAGSEGLPFVEDIEDVLDGAMQRLGYNFSSKQRMKAFLVTQLGKDGAEFVTSGVSGLPGAPIDVSGRLGMGNLIPGTGMFQKRTDHTRDLKELLGPTGDLATRAGQAIEQVLAGNVASAAKTIAPVAVRNVIKAADMADTGMYRDDKGNKIISTDGVEAVAKAMGFQPRSVKNVQDATVQVQKAKAQYILASGEIRAKMAQAIFLGDADKKQSARDDVAAWNRNNPDQRMTIDMPAVLRKVREMRKTKEQRIADTAPKAVRSQVRQQLREELH